MSQVRVMVFIQKILQSYYDMVKYSSFYLQLEGGIVQCEDIVNFS